LKALFTVADAMTLKGKQKAIALQEVAEAIGLPFVLLAAEDSLARSSTRRQPR
jgi:hypothetical protein